MLILSIVNAKYCVWFRYNIDRRITHPTFDSTGFELITSRSCESTFYDTDTAALTTWPSVTSHPGKDQKKGKTCMVTYESS